MKTERLFINDFMITMGNGTLGIGRDFVSAASGPWICHGTAEISGKPYPFRSSVNQDLAHRAVRLSAEREGKRLTAFTSQAL